MDVLHLVPSVGPQSGGMGTVAIALARHQQQIGANARVWCADPPNIAAAFDGKPPVVPLPAIGPRRFAFSVAGERGATTDRAELVHQHGLWTAQSRITGRFRQRGVVTVIAPHGSLEPYALARSAWKKRLALSWFESENLRSASCLQATHEQELRTFRDFGLRGPVAVVPNGIAPEWLERDGDGERFRRRHDLASDTRLMLFLSRLDPIKGLPLLIEAVAGLVDHLGNWCLVIAGPDPVGHRGEIERLAARSGVSRWIRFVGSVFDQEKRDALAASELFVLPTHSENFGIVIAEALACGVPVLTTHGAPWSEIEAHRCGWWVPLDPSAIGAALADAASRSPHELKAMGERGRALVASRYLWPGVAEQTVTLYRWLHGEVSRPSFVVLD